MKKALLSFLLLVPLFLHAQVPIDSVAVRQVDSLIQVSRELTGEFDKAMAIIADAKKITLEKLGRESAAYASCYFASGRILHVKGDYPAAENRYLEALAVREKVLGKQHPDYAHSLNSLGVLYWYLAVYKKAEPLLLEAKAIREKVLGKEHPDYAASLNNLANLCTGTGNYPKAEPLYVELSSINKTLLEKALHHLSERVFEEKQLTSALQTAGKKQDGESLALVYTRGARPMRSGDATGLYELIWQPLDSLLPEVKTVYYSPSGLLHRINFDAIPVNLKQSLSDRFQLVRLGSTRSLVVSDLTKTRLANDATLFGGIQYDIYDDLLPTLAGG